LSEKIGSTDTREASGGVLALPDGRFVLNAVEAGQSRLMVIDKDKGKAAYPLVNTAEQLFAPMVVAGPGTVAFVTGGQSAIVVADIASGRIVRRIPTKAAGPTLSLAISPD